MAMSNDRPPGVSATPATHLHKVRVQVEQPVITRMPTPRARARDAEDVVLFPVAEGLIAIRGVSRSGVFLGAALCKMTTMGVVPGRAKIRNPKMGAEGSDVDDAPCWSETVPEVTTRCAGSRRDLGNRPRGQTRSWNTELRALSAPFGPNSGSSNLGPAEDDAQTSCRDYLEGPARALPKQVDDSAKRVGSTPSPYTDPNASPAAPTTMGARSSTGQRLWSAAPATCTKTQVGTQHARPAGTPPDTLSSARPTGAPPVARLRELQQVEGAAAHGVGVGGPSADAADEEVVRDLLEAQAGRTLARLCPGDTAVRNDMRETRAADELSRGRHGQRTGLRRDHGMVFRGTGRFHTVSSAAMRRDALA